MSVRPMVNRDSAYFWEGTLVGELRIQQCNACQALRHPPGPACPACGALDRGYVVAGGVGTVYSYIVHRHPPVPGKETSNLNLLPGETRAVHVTVAVDPTGRLCLYTLRPTHLVVDLSGSFS